MSTHPTPDGEVEDEGEDEGETLREKARRA